MFVCPECHKQVKNLKQHQKRVHAGQAKEKPGAPAGNTLTLKVEPKTKPAAPPAALYHCVDCGETLTQGQTPCPGCGAHLDWQASP